MKVTNIRPLPSGNGRFRDVAIFDVEIIEGFRSLGLKLALAPDGKRFVFAPRIGGQRHAQFTGDFARRLGDAAWNAVNGGVAHDSV